MKTTNVISGPRDPNPVNSLKLEDGKREKARAEARAKELSRSSTEYLLELAKVTGRELSAVNAELNKRFGNGYQKVIALPCKVRELEMALVTYMNSHGLAGGTVNLFPDENGNLAVFIRQPNGTNERN